MSCRTPALYLQPTTAGENRTTANRSLRSSSQASTKDLYVDKSKGIINRQLRDEQSYLMQVRKLISSDPRLEADYVVRFEPVHEQQDELDQVDDLFFVESEELEVQPTVSSRLTQADCSGILETSRIKIRREVRR